MTLRALIFDVDGTLAETEELHRAAFNAAFEEAGLDWRWDPPLYARLLKTTGGKERIAAWTRDHLGRPMPEGEIAALHAAKTRAYDRLARREGLALRPGVAALIARGRAEGLRLAVATTTSRPNLDALAELVFGRSAGAVFDVIAAGDEVARKKPAPDVYRLALRRLGLPAEACLALEDSRNGILSARAAGIATVACAGRYTADEDHGEATRRVASFEALARAPDLAGFLAPEAA
ncbi:HAD-IA family hydrolase [Albimonas sp. CAU 1670]|uniref:HAD-IA family hydrolase n=1 Tax=Albimonas sp. CAU 1670 TaxID=3032599 RepID=UPI0023DB6563|nr:HAD-IA family hydrolase [Albimonas sp. CAU 1670]MDF2233602.1 HAD-IA family hydrolase [Albimonas sp. CAU 1670]